MASAVTAVPEQKALRVIATDLQQAFALRLGFNALGNDRKLPAHAPAERSRPPLRPRHDRGRIGCEGPVDLDLRNRQALQVAQRRIAGAEIIQRNGETEPPKTCEIGFDHIVSLTKTPSGFQLKLGRRRILGAHRFNLTREARSASCDAETLTATLSPFQRRVAKRAAEHKRAQLVNRPHSSATGMKMAGETQPRVECRHRSRASTRLPSPLAADLRLVEHLKHVVRQRGAKLTFDLPTRAENLIKVRL